MKKILVFGILIAVSINSFAAADSEVQRNIDARYKDMLRRQEIENRTKFLTPQESPQESPQEQTPQIQETSSMPKRRFKEIEVRRANTSNISNAKINKIISPYKNIPIGMSEIGDIQTRLQNLYVQSGYSSTRIYIDANTMPDDILTFVIMDGYIESIVFKNAKGKKYGRLANALQSFSFYPFACGELLDMRDIDQGTEQINRLSSNNASVEIIPSGKDGYSIIEIKNSSGKKFSLSLGADNGGTANTGIYKANSSLSADNLLMLNDALYFNYSRNIDGNSDSKENNSYFGSLTVPFGYFTFMLSAFNSDYTSPAGTSYGSYTSDGSTKNKNASLEIVIKRAQTHKVSAGAETAIKENENFFAGEKVDVSSKKLVTSSAFLTATYLMEGAMLYGKLSYVRGLDIFDAAKNSGVFGAPQAQFNSCSLYAQYSHSFILPFLKINASYACALNGQYSPDILYGSEQITLGGQGSVRGFKDTSVSGESGFYLRNDLSWKLSDIFKKEGFLKILTAATLNAFIDYGYARNDAYGADYQLAGAGAGLSYRIKYFNASVVWSKAIYNLSDLEYEGNVVYFSFEGKIYF
ncbi:MAG: ShlB/FhaC/HecB family hemolysin secretion/activation protein [Endomicrobium sp.]|jgi:hemolysin activation/secretion protein|nr:ShlB/FhaC/HecB family hemolysin secretion/activation protein [Endomicrobium sp.]